MDTEEESEEHRLRRFSMNRLFIFRQTPFTPLSAPCRPLEKDFDHSSPREERNLNRAKQFFIIDRAREQRLAEVRSDACPVGRG